MKGLIISMNLSEYFKKMERILKSELKEDYNEFNLLLENYRNKIIPKSFPEKFLDTPFSFKYRSRVIDLQGFAILSEDWINPLAEYIGNRKVLEIMGGYGSLAKCLSDRGVNIITTDNFSRTDKERAWIDNIEELDCYSAVKKYGKDVDIILVCWPPMSNHLRTVLNMMRKINKDAIMIYIGEHWDGCTASNLLFTTAEEIHDKRIDKINRLYPSWGNVYDKIMLFK